jgi:hypothetical protein
LIRADQGAARRGRFCIPRPSGAKIGRGARDAELMAYFFAGDAGLAAAARLAAW